MDGANDTLSPVLRNSARRCAAIRAPGAMLDPAAHKALDYLLAWSSKQAGRSP
jgi:hypothetical protein